MRVSALAVGSSRRIVSALGFVVTAFCLLTVVPSVTSRTVPRDSCCEFDLPSRNET
jgi:hypothetical protein